MLKYFRNTPLGIAFRTSTKDTQSSTYLWSPNQITQHVNGCRFFTFNWSASSTSASWAITLRGLSLISGAGVREGVNNTSLKETDPWWSGPKGLSQDGKTNILIEGWRRRLHSWSFRWVLLCSGKIWWAWMMPSTVSAKRQLVSLIMKKCMSLDF